MFITNKCYTFVDLKCIVLNSIINNYMINIKYINLIRNKEIVGECKLQQINDTETWLENVLI